MGKITSQELDTSLANTIDSKAPINNPTFTGTVGGITASMVGLGNVTNESKETMFTSPTFTGNVTLDGGSLNSSTVNIISPNGLVTKAITVDNSGVPWYGDQQIVVQTPYKRYGFRRDKNNSDPNTRIEYLYDAVGMIPAGMNFTTGAFNFGDWEEFINAVSRPVMLNNDGTVESRNR